MLCHDWPSVAPAIAAVRQAHEARRFDEAEWNASVERIDVPALLRNCRRQSRASTFWRAMSFALLQLQFVRGYADFSVYSVLSVLKLFGKI